MRKCLSRPGIFQLAGPDGINSATGGGLGQVPYQPLSSKIQRMARHYLERVNAGAPFKIE